MPSVSEFGTEAVRAAWPRRKNCAQRRSEVRRRKANASVAVPAPEAVEPEVEAEMEAALAVVANGEVAAASALPEAERRTRGTNCTESVAGLMPIGSGVVAANVTAGANAQMVAASRISDQASRFRGGPAPPSNGLDGALWAADMWQCLCLQHRISLLDCNAELLKGSPLIRNREKNNVDLSGEVRAEPYFHSHVQTGFTVKVYSY